jgi:Tol biopolymer transport system component
MSVEGGEPWRLTTDSADEFSPEFSPDGNEIVFHASKFGSRNIFVMRSDGSGVQQLTDLPGDEFHPHFSPYGRHVVFSYLSRSIEGPAGWTLYVVSRDGPGQSWGGPQPLPGGRGASGGRWSPDGSRIVARQGDGLVTLTWEGEVRRVVTQGDDLTLTIWPQWSRDGRRIYFTGADGEGRRGLYFIPAEGGNPRLAIRYPDPSKPVWSLATVGEGVVYLSVAENESDVYAMDLAIR